MKVGSKTQNTPTSLVCKAHQQELEHRNAGDGAANALSSLLRDSRHPASDIVFALRNRAPAESVPVVQALQKTHGNRYVQRLVSAAKSESPCMEICGTKVIQMKFSGSCNGCSFHREEEEAQKMELRMQGAEDRIQRKGVDGETPVVDESQIIEPNRIMEGQEKTLDPENHSFMESRLGHDFSRVQAHTDAKVAE